MVCLSSLMNCFTFNFFHLYPKGKRWSQNISKLLTEKYRLIKLFFGSTFTRREKGGKIEILKWYKIECTIKNTSTSSSFENE